MKWTKEKRLEYVKNKHLALSEMTGLVNAQSAIHNAEMYNEIFADCIKAMYVIPKDSGGYLVKVIDENDEIREMNINSKFYPENKEDLKSSFILSISNFMEEEEFFLTTL